MAHLVVSETGATADGIISERDLAHGLAEYGAEVLSRTAADLMTKAIVTCSPTDAIAQVAKTMTDLRIRHMPVTQGMKLVGIISIGDVVKFRLDELQLRGERNAQLHWRWPMTDMPMRDNLSKNVVSLVMFISILRAALYAPGFSGSISRERST